MSLLEDKVWLALKQVYDPEIPVNIADLGLIYEVKEFPINNIYIKMTITSPHCPAAAFLPQRVGEAAQNIEEVNDVHVDLVHNPPWTRELMTEEARKVFGYK